MILVLRRNYGFPFRFKFVAVYFENGDSAVVSLYFERARGSVVGASLQGKCRAERPGFDYPTDHYSFISTSHIVLYRSLISPHKPIGPWKRAEQGKKGISLKKKVI